MEKPDNPTPWKVIYTASRQEKKVAVLLERFGIAYYLPLVKKLRLWSDRKKWVEMPLFNGYVFVKPEPGIRDKVWIQQRYFRSIQPKKGCCFQE